MNVYVTEPPNGSPPVLLHGRFARELGTFALLIGPAEKTRTKRTRKTVSTPFLHCLGKNLQTVGSYTAMTVDFRAQIAHWFAAYDARELVVFNGHVLYPDTMRAAFDYAATVPNITFACEPGMRETTRARIGAAGINPRRRSWDTLLARLPVTPEPTPAPEPAYDMVHLPMTDFLLFRHEARTINTPARFDAIDADYRMTYANALTVEPTLNAVVSMLARVTRRATTTAPLMVALRATQAALLTRGYHLSVHRDRAIGVLCSIRSPNPTTEHWRALHGYVRTQRVAGVALYLLDIPPDELPTVTVGHVQQFLDTGHVRTHPLPDLARPLLKAQLEFRYSQQAGPDDPYLNQKGARRHLEDIVDARRHLGIPIDAHYLRGGHIAHTERPLWRLGLELRSLS